MRNERSMSPNRRQKDLTNLEMEALTLVNEEILGPAVTNEEKYEQLLESRKERKPVSKIFHIRVFQISKMVVFNIFLISF